MKKFLDEYRPNFIDKKPDWRITFQTAWPAFTSDRGKTAQTVALTHTNKQYVTNMIDGMHLYFDNDHLSMTGCNRMAPTIERILFDDPNNECPECFGARNNPWDNPEFNPSKVDGHILCDIKK